MFRDTLIDSIHELNRIGIRDRIEDSITEHFDMRWKRAEFDKIDQNCNNCLEVFYQKDLVTPKDGNRIPKEAYVVNVVAVQKGTKYPNRYIIMTGDIDSRNSDTMDYTNDAPGANPETTS